jgi:hypothetical protein
MRIFRYFALAFVLWVSGACAAEARQCSFTLTPTSFAVGSIATSRTLSIITGTQCSWTAVSTVSWITVTSGAAGTSIGSVTFAVEQNPGAAARIGTLIVAGQTVTVTQDTSGCTTSVTPTSFAMDALAGSRTVSVVSGTQCSWSSTPGAAWITVVSGASGSGIGAVTFSVTANTSTAGRTGVLTIGGQAVTITQSGSGGAGGGGAVPSAPANFRFVR